MNLDATPEHVDDQTAISVTVPSAMEHSMYAFALPRRACCAGAGEDADALAQAMQRPRRTRRVA